MLGLDTKDGRTNTDRHASWRSVWMYGMILNCGILEPRGGRASLRKEREGAREGEEEGEGGRVGAHWRETGFEATAYFLLEVAMGSQPDPIVVKRQLP